MPTGLQERAMILDKGTLPIHTNDWHDFATLVSLNRCKKTIINIASPFNSVLSSLDILNFPMDFLVIDFM